MARRLYRLKEVSAITGLPVSSLYRKMKHGLFPLPIPLGARAVAWIADEVDKWIERQIEQPRTILVRVPQLIEQRKEEFPLVRIDEKNNDH